MDDALLIYTKPTSKINPLIANIFLLIVVSAATIEPNIHILTVILLLTVLVTIMIALKPIQILKTMHIVVPFGLGLGVFYGLVGQEKMHTAILTIMMRVEILATGSAILYYGVDPWELPTILINKLKIQPYISYTIAIAFTMYLRLAIDLKEITESLKSKNIIRNHLDYILRIHKILYVLIYHAARRADELEIVLEARNFNPSTRSTRKNLTIRPSEILLIAVTLAMIIGVKIFLNQ